MKSPDLEESDDYDAARRQVESFSTLYLTDGVFLTLDLSHLLISLNCSSGTNAPENQFSESAGERCRESQVHRGTGEGE